MTELVKNRSSTGIAVLAGNSRVHLRDDESICVEPQLKAFGAALRFSAEHRDSSGTLPKISLAFDHPGIFRLQFLRDDLTNSQKRNPKLVHLKPVIVEVFAGIAADYGISLDQIRVIHEDSARQHAVHVLNTTSLPQVVRKRIVSRVDVADDVAIAEKSELQPAERLTCAMITKEYFEKATCEDTEEDAVLEVFFEDCAWSRDLAYVRGLQLSHLLGLRTAIRLNRVDQQLNIIRGHLIQHSGR